MSIELKVKRDEYAKEFDMLHIAKAGDVGMDLPAITPIIGGDDIEKIHQVIEIQPGSRVTVPTGIKIELPDGYWASIEARSSTSEKLLIIPKGVIDTGYRGELFIVLINVGRCTQYIRHGDRLAQLIIQRNIADDIIIKEVDELSQSERGETGFGSSGSSSVKTNV